MNETVLNLVNAIKSGDAIATEQAFADAMAEKLSSRIDDMRQSVAANMFDQPVVEEGWDPEQFGSDGSGDGRPGGAGAGDIGKTDKKKKSVKPVAEETIEEGSNATDDGLQTRMNKNFTKSVATRYDGTRKQEAEGKKGLVKTAKIIKSRGGDAAAAKQKASDKNDYENEMM